MTSLENLKACTTLDQIASLLGFKASGMSYLLYKMPNTHKYTIFKINKKSGGEREIKAPVDPLKNLQGRLANILNECSEEIFLKNKHPSPNKKYRSLSHGFRKNHSIATNASCHKNKRYVLNLDLEDFFPSFNFGRVRGFFINNNNFVLPKNIATILAQIACHDNSLPQGSPCSPIITNLITHILDIKLVQLAKKYGCTYSRYADDITFSTNQKNFPFNIANKITEEQSAWRISPELEKIINKAGFNVKHTKTRLQYKESRQSVTGLVVNKGVNIKRDYYNYTRAMCKNLFSKGEFFFNENLEQGKINQLEGILNHIYYIKEFSVTEDQKKERKNVKGKIILRSSSELYSKFLFFKHFIALDKPLIMCEGKTDIVYLKCAIRQLANKKIYSLTNKVKFFRNTKLVDEVMRIYEGAASLKNFMEFYEKDTKFSAIPKLHPVIVLLDNDKEADSAIKFIENKYKHPGVVYDRATTFMYHVTENLYLVIMPKFNGNDSKIEDFFDPKLLETEIGGKKFKLTNKQSGDKGENGKHIFATKVIKPNEDTIDFNNFVPMLTSISSAIDDYKNRCDTIVP